MQILRAPAFGPTGKRYLSVNSARKVMAYLADGTRVDFGGPTSYPGFLADGTPAEIDYETLDWSMMLTTLERVREQLGGLGDADTQNDDLIVSIIDDVSVRFERYLRKTIARQTYTEPLRLHRGQKILTLAAAPIVSITSVKYATHPSLFAGATAMAAELYTSYDGAGQVELLQETRYRPGFVQVVYVGGMADDTTDFVARYPDIARQADVQVIYEFDRKNNPGGNITATGGGTQFERGLELLPGVRQCLDQYQRITIAG